MAGSQDHTTPIYSQNSQIEPTEIPVTQHDGDLNESSRSDDCVICLDTISEPCTTHPCAHTHFDFLCLLSWLEQRASCPLCQAPVFKVSYTNNEKPGESVYRVPNVPRKRNEEPRNLQETRPQRTVFGPTDLHASRFYRRQRPRREPPRPPVTEADAIEHRRHVYRHLLFSLRSFIPTPTPIVPTTTDLYPPHPDVGTNRSSQYRQSPTPVQFTSTPHLVSRAPAPGLRPTLRRR